MLNPIVSTAPQQCVPPCPNGSREEQNGSIARSNCVKPCPSTSSAPTTTAWAPNCAFGLPPGIPQRCCSQSHTSQLFAFAHQCSAGLCTSHTLPAPYPRVDISTENAAPNEVHTSLPSNMPRGGGIPQAWPKQPCSGPTSRFRTGGRMYDHLVAFGTTHVPCKAGFTWLGCCCHPARAGIRGNKTPGPSQTRPHAT